MYYLLPFDLVEIIHDYYSSHYIFERKQAIHAQIKWRRVTLFLKMVFENVEETYLVLPVIHLLQTYNIP